jgi:hypothetical protein
MSFREVTCPGCHTTLTPVLIDGVTSFRGYPRHFIQGSDIECQFSKRPLAKDEWDSERPSSAVIEKIESLRLSTHAWHQIGSTWECVAHRSIVDGNYLFRDPDDQAKYLIRVNREETITVFKQIESHSMDSIAQPPGRSQSRD